MTHAEFMHILSGHLPSMLTIVLWKHGIMKSGAREKVALFVNRPMALQCIHDIEINVQVCTKRACTQWSALCSPVEQKCYFFPSTLLNKTDVLIMKITINCKEWQLKLCVIKFSLYIMLIFEWTNYMSYIKKCQTGTYIVLFWLSVCVTPTLHVQLDILKCNGNTCSCRTFKCRSYFMTGNDLKLVMKIHVAWSADPFMW